MNSPVSPQEWYETGVLLRREECFGEAINAFSHAASLASRKVEEGTDVEEMSKIRAASLAFIELIHEITSFANTDLMNP